ncbi:MAG TPA: hypothetical protein VHA75_18090, partial [Rugosimonospora sp.]|nr:hypothetical protein [Rugosimonospora sp.]
ELAEANPALAVLAALCHGGEPEVDAMFPALARALRTLGPERAVLYHDIVLAGLPVPARVRWETFMALPANQYRSEYFRTLATEYEQIGEARGEAQAVLTVLDARGIAVPPAARERVVACTDLARLQTWVRRAATAATLDEVLAD